jgi:hypothetical protein
MLTYFEEKGKNLNRNNITTDRNNIAGLLKALLIVASPKGRRLWGGFFILPIFNA